MKSFESLSIPLSRQQSGGRRPPPRPPPPPPPLLSTPPKLPLRRGSRGLNSSDRSTLMHLRRSELAGWRTKSVFPSQREGPNPNCFLPILKLRGLPFFCTRKHVCQWLGDLASQLKDLIFVLEVDSLTTGFGLVTFHTSQAAYDAWQKLHKAPIVGKRFVEVFALFPPHCPLSRRESAAAALGSSGLSAARSLEPPAVTSGDGANGAYPSAPIPDPNLSCCFCGFPYWQHGDHGVASYATLRMRRLMNSGVLEYSPGLMHTAFLKVPALLFQDAGAVSRHEIDLFDPDIWREQCGLSIASETGVLSLEGLDSALRSPSNQVFSDRFSTFFDLLRVESYHMRILISEITDILVKAKRLLIPSPGEFIRQRPGTLSIADIGNRLSTRARAYLFLTEIKLKNVLETFEEFFVVSDPIGPHAFYSVSLTSQLFTRGSILIWSMQPYQLSRRGRRRESHRGGGKSSTPEVLRLQPLERRSTHIASTQLAGQASLAASSASVGLSPTNGSPCAQLSGVCLARATSCAAHRDPPNYDFDGGLLTSPSFHHRRSKTPSSPGLDVGTATTTADDEAPTAANGEPLSQALVDFIKSVPGLDSLVAADSGGASSRRLSHWAPTGISPPLGALTLGSRSSTAPGMRSPWINQSPGPGGDMENSEFPFHYSMRRNGVSPTEEGNRPWVATGGVESMHFRQTPERTSSYERQQLINTLLRQKEEVEAKIEQALNYSVPLLPPVMPQYQPPQEPGSQPVGKGLGTFANDLLPMENIPLLLDQLNDFPFDQWEEFLVDDMQGANSNITPLGQEPPMHPSHSLVASGYSNVELSHLLKALDR